MEQQVLRVDQDLREEHVLVRDVVTRLGLVAEIFPRRECGDMSKDLKPKQRLGQGPGARRNRIIIWAVTLAACGGGGYAAYRYTGTTTVEVPVSKVRRAEFVISVRTRGEIRSTKSVVLSAPQVPDRSPYAITDYYDIDPDLAVDVNNRMGEFEYLVKRTHQAKLKVIIDFVPNHVARQYHSIMKPVSEQDLGENDDVNMNFSPDNNFYYCPGTPLQLQFDNSQGEGEPYYEMPAKATGNDRFDNRPEMNDWYETVKLNYGIDYFGGRSCYFDPIPDTWIKMLNILLFWASKGIDGFRCDMAEMVPVEFWQWAISKVKEQYPAVIFIGEVYNPAEYRNYIHKGGFDFLYDKVGMYDTLCSVISGNAPASAISSAWQSLDDIHDHSMEVM